MSEPNTTGMPMIRNGWRTMRPEQWTKNLVVAAPFFFALGDRTQSVSTGLLLRAISATLLFCLIAGGVYIFNDLMDLEADRRHPTKRQRPLASGAFPPLSAWPLAAVLMGLGLLSGMVVSLPLAFLMSLYLGLQFVYTIWLKKIPLLDILVIATGFVIRALAGAAAVSVPISAWLIICTFLLALFLALCKRRHEKTQVDKGVFSGSRSSLKGYRRDILDRLAIVLAAAVILAYAGYAAAPETVQKFGDRRLLATLPFVIFGIARYLVLVLRRNLGDRPERILLTDLPMLMTLALYGATVMVLTLWLP